MLLHQDNKIRKTKMWTNIHDQIKDEVDNWTVKDLFGYKADRLHSGDLYEIIEAVVQDLYEARYSEEEQEAIEAPYWEEHWKQKRANDARTYKGSYREARDKGMTFEEWMMS
tara:strand:- start:81 stop:416 length:336 start_codon:yes stop_codon:yes gene_type:complete